LKPAQNVPVAASGRVELAVGVTGPSAISEDTKPQVKLETGPVWLG